MHDFSAGDRKEVFSRLGLALLIISSFCILTMVNQGNLEILGPPDLIARLNDAL